MARHSLWLTGRGPGACTGQRFRERACRTVELKIVDAQHEAMNDAPYYLIISVGRESYVLDRNRALIRRGASRLLLRFARTHGKPMSLEDTLWDDFSQEHGFSTEERKCPCLYSLVRGDETLHQLALLSVL